MKKKYFAIYTPASGILQWVCEAADKKAAITNLFDNVGWPPEPPYSPVDSEEEFDPFEGFEAIEISGLQYWILRGPLGHCDGTSEEVWRVIEKGPLAKEED